MAFAVVIRGVPTVLAGFIFYRKAVEEQVATVQECLRRVVSNSPIRRILRKRQ